MEVIKDSDQVAQIQSQNSQPAYELEVKIQAQSTCADFEHAHPLYFIEPCLNSNDFKFDGSQEGISDLYQKKVQMSQAN